ncbi:hypothetical protein P389DRAFT_10212 [Cystobasidium minutum MCA 4210]|uniref:uncharacterized protein n=1 Tax=Cystobasidium minutum MCA 4210 TaxID=1397322 RepID=UPI0034CD3A60|eukprot:jgi/Rhomi1/10212/CE10211_673
MSGDTLPDSAKRPAADDAAGEDEASKRARMSEGGSIEQPLAPKPGTTLRILIKAQNNSPLPSAASSTLSTPTVETNSRQSSVTAPRLRPIRLHTATNLANEVSGNTRSNPQSPAFSVKDIGPYAPIDGHYFELQDARCHKKYSRAKKCSNCTTKNAGTECLFKGLRVFIIRKASPVVTEHTPVFFCTFISEHKSLEYPSQFSRPITSSEKQQLLKLSVTALRSTIYNSLKHASLSHAVHRPHQGRVCHTCSTSFFLSYWFCTGCGRSYCIDCYAKIDKYLPDLGETKPATNPESAMVAAQRIAQGSPAFQTTYALDRSAHMTKVSNGRIANDSIRSMLACSNSKLHGVNSLIPVTTQTREYISTLCQEASRIRSLPILPSATPSSPKYPRPDGAVHYHVDEHPIWTDAKAMIISGLETKWEVDWSPSSFASAFARKDCEIEQTVTGTLRTTKVSGFFNDYGKAVKSVEGVWRIKDWLPSRDLKDWQPDLYDDFIQMLPMPDLTRPDGALNLASHVPVDGHKSFLGPHLYCAYRSEDKDGVGTTKLHIEAMDAINIMVHASGQEKCETLWHIFPRESLGLLREYCYEYLAKIVSGRQRRPTTANELKRTLTDPILWQQIYFGPLARAELAIRGAVCRQIRQKVGEAITIPAGCAYQSCNLADCIKVAVSFVSMESVKYMFSGSQTEDTFESRKENGAWKGDMLQLKSLLYHAWMSLEQPPHTSARPAHAPRSAKSTAFTPISAKGSSTAAERASSAGSTVSSDSANKKPAASRQPRPPLYPQKRKSLPRSASPTLYAGTLYEQPPMSDLRSVPGSPAPSSATEASNGKAQSSATTSAGSEKAANSTGPRSNAESANPVNKVASHILLDDDMDLDLETPVISKRPLPRLRGRSPSEIEPVLKPLNTSHIRQRPASSLPEDQNAFFDELVTMLFDPKADLETGLSDADAQEVRIKLRAIVKKIYLASIEHGGTADYDALLQAAEPEVIAIFEFAKARTSPSKADVLEPEEHQDQTGNSASSNIESDSLSKSVDKIDLPTRPSSRDAGATSRNSGTSEGGLQANQPVATGSSLSSTIARPLDTTLAQSAPAAIQQPASSTDRTGPSPPLRSVSSSPPLLPSPSAIPPHQQSHPSQATGSPAQTSTPTAVAPSRAQIVTIMPPAMTRDGPSSSTTPQPVATPQNLNPVPYFRPPTQASSTSKPKNTSRQLPKSVATPNRPASNPPSPAVIHPVLSHEPIYLRLPTRPQAHEERPYTTEAPPTEPLRLDLRGTTQAAYWYSLYG